MSSITAFAPESFALSFTDKKGTMHNITPEGAVFKGGAALTALKDHAIDSAMAKAISGRYRPASDILAAGFPAIAKKGESYTHVPTWTNKESFIVFIDAILGTELKAGKSWTLKQAGTRAFAQALRLAIAAPVRAVETIEV